MFLALLISSTALDDWAAIIPISGSDCMPEIGMDSVVIRELGFVSFIDSVLVVSLG